MTNKRTEDMIHEALESGGSITQAKENDQKLIAALMSLKCLPRSYVSGGSQNEDQV
jgi:hypothetical protein